MPTKEAALLAVRAPAHQRVCVLARRPKRRRASSEPPFPSAETCPKAAAGATASGTRLRSEPCGSPRETNDKVKTKSIADAEARIEDLTSKIEELTAGSARLNTEIKNTDKVV